MPHEIQTHRLREQARKQVGDLNGFDYTAPAELYPSRSRKMRGPAAYKRFDNAADALRYAIEELAASALVGATLEVDEVRFGHAEMRYLYDNAAYPLKRRTPAV